MVSAGFSFSTKLSAGSVFSVSTGEAISFAVAAVSEAITSFFFNGFEVFVAAGFLLLFAIAIFFKLMIFRLQIYIFLKTILNNLQKKYNFAVYHCFLPFIIFFISTLEKSFKFDKKNKKMKLVIGDELINFCKQLENELTGINKNCVTFALKNEDYEGIISCFGDQAETCEKEFEEMLQPETLNRLKLFYKHLKK